MLDLVFGGRYLTFETPLSLEEATKRMEREMVPPSVRAEWRRPMERRMFEKRPQSFIGTLADGRFHMVRLIRGRGSVRPWIDGTLSRAVNGCRVDVRLKMPTLAIVACIPPMVIGVFALFLAVLYPAFVLFFFFGLVMVLAPFIHSMNEARKAEQLLATLLEAQPSRSVVDRRPVRSTL